MVSSKRSRRFVKTDEVLDDLSRIEPYFQRLMGADISAPEALEEWLLDGSELAACIGEVRTDRYVQMTCHTDDTALRQKYLDFVEKIDPQCQRFWQQLNVKYTESDARKKLPQERYSVLDRSTEASVELFREENIPLQVEEKKLAQEYQQVCGEMIVEFEGREQTLQQLNVYAEHTDREIRYRAWKIGSERRFKDHQKLDRIFDSLIELRDRQAANAGLKDYRDYAFKAYQRFDYTPADCETFHEAIEKTVLPAVKKLNIRRKEKLGIDKLRPWDLSVDEDGAQGLKPFTEVGELCDKCEEIFGRVDPDLKLQFADMRNKGYLDLDSRKGKAPGGYQSTYEEGRYPFIFMNAVGLHRDVTTLLHEGGHAFHTYATEEEDILAYRHAPIEFSEVASMTMELLGLDHLDVVYEGQKLRRARQKQLEGILRIFPWVALIDSFQHWIYTHQGHSREDRTAAWLRLHHQFNAGVDYSGYENMERNLWQKQLHLFEVPFYYIEYAIAQLGALQLWVNVRREGSQAVKKYRQALALGGSRRLPELFEAAGARFDFSYGTMAPLIETVQEELEKLND